MHSGSLLESVHWALQAQHHQNPKSSDGLTKTKISPAQTHLRPIMSRPSCPICPGLAHQFG